VVDLLHSARARHGRIVKQALPSGARLRDASLWAPLRYALRPSVPLPLAGIQTEARKPKVHAERF